MSEIVYYLLILCVLWNGDALAQDITFRGDEKLNSCITPFGIEGSCVPIMKCPGLVRLIRGSPNDLRLVQQSQCGFQDGSPLVCCLELVDPPTPVTPSTVSPEPVISANVTLPTVNCGISAFFKIIGGVTASLGAWPWAALLFYERNGRDIGNGCGGSLINDRYVLTAAHCVSPDLAKNATLSMVRLGEHDILSDLDSETTPEGVRTAPAPQDFKAEKIIKHPDFRIDQNNIVWDDIALIRLDRPVEFHDFVSPVCLPDGVQDLSSQTHAYVIGWGALGPGQRASDDLQQVNLPLVEINLCSLAFTSSRNPIQLDERVHKCAGGEAGQDSCRGDSGGPLQVGTAEGKFYQIGVLSFGARRCGIAGIPGVYANVASYRQWILENMEP